MVLWGSMAVATAQGTADKDIVADFVRSLQQLREETYASPATSDEISPLLFRILGPTTFYSSTLRSPFSLDSLAARDEDEALAGEIDQQLRTLYLTQPQMLRHHDGEFSSEQLVRNKSEKKNKLSEDVRKAIADDLKAPKLDAAADDIGDIGLTIEKPNFWKTSGTFSLQFTQNYFSENWYKGGNNNETMLASLILQANYNDQQRIAWDNRLELRLGFVTTTSDSCHTFLTNNDKINLASKLGVKAAKSWYYTLSFEANTQFLPGYRTNDRRTYSDFLSPLDVYLSVGMDFKPSLKQGNTLSVAILPLSYKARYINHEDENILRVYKLRHRNFQQDFGSKLELNAKMKLANNFYWRSRCYYFTSYKYVEAELENAFQFQFSKYISSELYTLWRFDDNRPAGYYDDHLGYFQFKEYFTLGLTYAF